MLKNISADYIETLVNDLGNKGLKQIGLAPIRQKQDDELCRKLIDLSIERIRQLKLTKDPGRHFFVGSVDFMVNKSPAGCKLYVLETNGGSSRGFSVMPEDAWANACLGYSQAVDYSDSRNPLVLIGHPDNDLLMYEKIVLGENVKEYMATQMNLNAVVTNVSGLATINDKPAIVMDSYKNIIPHLDIAEDYVTLNSRHVDVVIGDGVARRNKKVCEQLLSDTMNTVVVNEIFHITDDKSLTYTAVTDAARLLSQFNVKPLLFFRALDKGQLLSLCGQALESASEVLIKPHGGSGGTGIDIITEKDDIEQKVESSISHYIEKFGEKRDPFPYTICERVDSTPVSWRGAKHQFDVRIYVAKQGSEIHPLGALSRIAIEPFVGKFTKKSFVVNLSGYGGVDTSRGLGISKDSLDVLNLDEEDFINMLCASSSLMSYIATDYPNLKKIVEAEKNGCLLNES